MDEYIDLDTPLELKVVWGSTYKPYTSTLRELLDVNHIPYTAADVVPVRHGEWSQTGYDHGLKVCECSVCKKRAYGSTKFCPNCGADMREES